MSIEKLGNMVFQIIAVARDLNHPILGYLMLKIIGNSEKRTYLGRDFEY